MKIKLLVFAVLLPINADAGQENDSNGKLFSNTSATLYEQEQYRNCEGFTSKKQYSKAISACVPLIWSNNLSIREKASNYLNKSSEMYNKFLLEDHQRRERKMPVLNDPYIVPGACTTDGQCGYGVWQVSNISESVPVYDRPGGNKIIWNIVKGERVAATTSQMLVHPLKGEVIGQNDKVRIGDPVFLLLVHDFFQYIWAGGKLMDEEEVLGSCNPFPSCMSAFKFPIEHDKHQFRETEWWVKVVRRNEQIGWIRANYGRGDFVRPVDDERYGSIKDPFDYTTNMIGGDDVVIPDPFDKVVPIPWYQKIVPGSRISGYTHGQFPSEGQKTHPGVDIGAACGTDVLSADSGKVVRIVKEGDKHFKTLGNAVVIQHADQPDGRPTYTLYLHLNKAPLVGLGSVQRWHKLGEVGETGFATKGCHVHFEVRHFKGIDGLFHPVWRQIYASGDMHEDAAFKGDWSDPEQWFRGLPTITSVVSGSANQASESSKDQVRRERERGVREFLDDVSSRDLRVNEEEKILSGTWRGFASSGSDKLDYLWDIEQKGPKVEGTISIKMPKSSDWSRYRFEGTFQNNILIFNGTRWQTSRKGSFCLASGTLKLTRRMDQLSLNGFWGSNPIPGGCPDSSSGGIELTRQ